RAALHRIGFLVRGDADRTRKPGAPGRTHAIGLRPVEAWTRLLAGPRTRGPGTRRGDRPVAGPSGGRLGRDASPPRPLPVMMRRRPSILRMAIMRELSATAIHAESR